MSMSYKIFQEEICIKIRLLITRKLRIITNDDSRHDEPHIILGCCHLQNNRTLALCSRLKKRVDVTLTDHVVRVLGSTRRATTLSITPIYHSYLSLSILVSACIAYSFGRATE